MAKKKTASAPIAAPARKPRSSNSKAAKLDLAQANTAVQFASTLTVEQLVANMGALQTTVQGSLAGLSAQLTSKLAESQQMDSAIAEMQRRFKELTEKEAEAVTLDELKLEIENTRKQWAADEAEAQRQHQLDAVHRSEEAARQNDQFAFDTKQAEARWEVEFEAKKADAERTAKIREDEMLRGWMLREQAMKEKETEIAEMRTAVAGHEAAIKAAVDKAVSDTTASLAATHNHQVTLIRKESESAVALAKQELAATAKALQAERESNAVLAKRAEDAEARTLSVMQSALNVNAANARADAVQQTASSAANSRGGK